VFRPQSKKASGLARKRLRVLALIGLSCTVFWFVAYVLSILLLVQKKPVVTPLLAAEYFAEDFRSRYGDFAPRNPNIVFLGIDKSNYTENVFPGDLEQEPALEYLCQDFPWNRAFWGKAIDKLVKAGAKVVIIDLLFLNEGKGDREFKEAIERNREHVVIGANIVYKEALLGERVYNSIQLDWPVGSVAGPLEGSRDVVGLVNFWPDPDEVVRAAYYASSLASAFGAAEKAGDAEYDFPSLALLAALKGGDVPSDISSYKNYRRFRFAGEPGYGFGYRSLSDIFIPAFWKQNFADGKFFEGKYVVIGPAANWMHDYHKSPFQNEMLGPEVHCNALNALLGGHYIQTSPLWLDLSLILALGLAAFGLSAYFKQPGRRFVSIIASAFAYAALTYVLYNRESLQLLTVTPLLCLGSGGLVSMVYEFIQERLEKARVRSTLERYVSKNVVAEMLDRSEEYQAALGGQRRPVTVLFSDVRGFTTMTEAASDSQAFVAQLNEYLSAMVAVVFRHNGTLDKFIGDAVMAVWGNTTSSGPADDAKRAAKTALEMLEELDRLNKKWAEEGGRIPYKIGIGLNHGEVICGNMGSLERMEFTVIGDAVNLASRLEGTTKEYGITLMIGESVAPFLRDDYLLQTVDYIQVKGKTKPVDTFTLLPFDKATVPNEVSNALKDYEAGILAYRAGKFTEAEHLFLLASNVHPISILAREFRERCQTLIAHPPEEPWTGVYIMTKK
jgi:adenylate cyclase